MQTFDWLMSFVSSFDLLRDDDVTGFKHMIG